MELNIKGKTALVCGGTSGIGLGVARCLAQEGVITYLLGRDEEKAKRASQSVPNSLPVVLDLTNDSQVRDKLTSILKNPGVDILINNIGGPPSGSLGELKIQDFDKGYHMIVRTVLLMVELCAPVMKERRWGRIVNITSTSAKEVIPNLPVSSTFRAGLTALNKEMAKHWGPFGVLINNVLPGLTQTERLKELEKKSPELYRDRESLTAVRRLATPEDIGKVVTFLASDANQYVTGTNILVDGGLTKAL